MRINAYGLEDIKLEKNDSVLEALAEARVLSVERTTAGTVVLNEACDDYYWAELSQIELKRLINELLALTV